MNKTTVATADGFKDAIQDEKYIYLDKFEDICEILLDNMDYEHEYYPTCESVFTAIEEKCLDINCIVKEEDYNDFKKKVINYNFPCLSMGKAPKPKYTITTSDGFRKYTTNHDHSEHLML